MFENIELVNMRDYYSRRPKIVKWNGEREEEDYVFE